MKEPVASEYGYLRPDLALFAYLHLAANRPLTAALLDAGTTAIAYETVQLTDRSLPSGRRITSPPSGRGLCRPGVSAGQALQARLVHASLPLIARGVGDDDTPDVSRGP